MSLEQREVPILEYDAKSKPIVDARAYADAFYSNRKDIKRCIFTYFTDIVDQYERELKLNQVFRMRTEGYRPRVYEMQVGKEHIYVLPMPIGAPQAARMMEILAAIGVEKFMVCGGAAVLGGDNIGEKIMVPTSAVRDEGVSYHYLPPAREVQMNAAVRTKILETLKDEKIEFVEVKTWTTDAIFRETVDKVELRKAEGCNTVEMECAAFYSVAKHLGLLCGQLLYTADVVSKKGWDYRDWHTKTESRAQLFDLAVKCLMKL